MFLVWFDRGCLGTCVYSLKSLLSWFVRNFSCFSHAILFDSLFLMCLMYFC